MSRFVLSPTEAKGFASDVQQAAATIATGLRGPAQRRWLELARVCEWFALLRTSRTRRALAQVCAGRVRAMADEKLAAYYRGLAHVLFAASRRPGGAS